MAPLELLIASFTAPINIGTDPQSVLWLLPLAAAISIVYKATKLPQIRAADFIKETAVLWGSIIVVMVIAAVVLHGFAWLVTE